MKDNLIWSFFKKNKLTYLAGLIFMLTASYIQTLFPKVLGETIDMMKESSFSQAAVKQNILYILLIALATFILAFTWRNLIIGNARKMECTFREELFRHFQRLSPTFYSKRKTGDLIAYAINDLSAVRMAFGPATAISINGIVICASSIYFMATFVSVKLTLLSLVPLPFLITFILIIGKKIQVLFKIVQKNFGAISDKVQENIYGIRVIKSYVQEDQEIEDFGHLNNTMMESNLKMVRVSSYMSPAIEICFSISFVINLMIGSNMVINGAITLGDFIAFNTYLTMIMQPIVSIGRVVNHLRRGMASLERLNEIFAIQPDVKDKEDALNLDIHGEITFKNLTFCYEDADIPAVAEVNLSIEQGQTIGIIGRTGSGKSTLANLLLHLYNVGSGEIFLDGRDINDYSLHSIKNAFGYVAQDTFLFSATIKENIAFFRDDFTCDQILQAARCSHIYDSIMDFPDGFDTSIGERGVNLSGGQKQRVAIARAVIREPAVLVLDDALSAVDSETEGLILEELKALRKDKTTIIISHKISSIAAADQIVVMDGGRIVEKGTCNELIEKGGAFYDIVQEQIHQD